MDTDLSRPPRQKPAKPETPEQELYYAGIGPDGKRAWFTQEDMAYYTSGYLDFRIITNPELIELIESVLIADMVGALKTIPPEVGQRITKLLSEIS
jgi:hypothetical protein